MKHNLIAPLRFIPFYRRVFSAVSVALSLVFALAAFGEALGTGFTYQGQLRRSGAAYTGTCNFQFDLWSVISGGGPQSNTISINSVSVVNGLFTVQLDFGNLFDGFIQYYLATSVQCTGDAGFTALTPRTLISAVPYAVTLRPGAVISSFGDFPMLSVFNNSTTAGATGIKATGVTGLYGATTSSTGSGVQGDANGGNAAGVFGLNTAGAGIWGRTTAGGSAVYGEVLGGGLAGRFIGPVNVQGTLTKSAGTFLIDHPLDPANKFLSHSFVESPDMMNIYNGNVTTDATGSATVTLPDYFAALNRDYRYQLTVVGQFAQAIVSRKVAQNSFEIRTDKPGVEVSWQVTGIRQDAYAKEHPIAIEEFKPAEEKGLYLYPAGFGAGEEKRIGHLQAPLPASGASHPASK